MKRTLGLAAAVCLLLGQVQTSSAQSVDAGADLGVSGYTIVISPGTALPSGVDGVWTSLNGVLAPNPNTGQGVVPGDLNFIQYVAYGGLPAQNWLGPIQFTPPGPGFGVNDETTIGLPEPSTLSLAALGTIIFLWRVHRIRNERKTACHLLNVK